MQAIADNWVGSNSEGKRKLKWDDACNWDLRELESYGRKVKFHIREFHSPARVTAVIKMVSCTRCGSGLMDVVPAGTQP